MSLPTLRAKYQAAVAPVAVPDLPVPPVPAVPRPAKSHSPFELAAEEAGHLRRILEITDHSKGDVLELRIACDKRLKDLGYGRGPLRPDERRP